MNKISTFMLAVAVAGSAMAVSAAPVKAPAGVPQAKAIANGIRPAKAPGVTGEIIDYPPEGEIEIMTRECDAFRVQAFEATHSTSFGSILRTVTTSDGEVYFSSIVSEYPVETWVKGRKEGSTIVLEGIQPIYQEWDDYEEAYVDTYLVPMTLVVDENNRGTYVPAADLKYVFNVAADGTLTSADPTMLLGICTYGYVGTADEPDFNWSGFGDRNVTVSEFHATPVAIPDGAKPERWVWKENGESSLVNVVTDGNDIYIAGMDRELPDAWVKGTVTGDKVIFPSGQYLGPDYAIAFFSFFCGAEFEMVKDPDSGEEVLHASLADNAVFSYDAANKRLTSDNGYIINSDATRLFPLYAYQDVVVEQQHRNPDTKPAAPYDLVYESGDWDTKIWFQIPNTDVDGNLLDESRLYYQILTDGEVLTLDTETYWDLEEELSLIPYDFQSFDIYVERADHTVYLYTQPEKSVGVRSVYLNENDQLIYSAATNVGTSVAIDGIEASRQAVATEYFDLAGRRIQRPANGGVYVRSTRWSDGSVTRSKVAVR